MSIPTEPIGSIPRPLELVGALAATDAADPALDPLYQGAIRDTVRRFKATGSARCIPLRQLGTTDDRGFAPFSDDTSTSRDTAFAKTRSRVLGTALASEVLGSA